MVGYAGKYLFAKAQFDTIGFEGLSGAVAPPPELGDSEQAVMATIVAQNPKAISPLEKEGRKDFFIKFSYRSRVRILI